MFRLRHLAAVLALAPAGARAQRPGAAPIPAPGAGDAAPAAPVPDAVRRAAGCYALEPGPWERDSALAWLVPLGRLPRRFRLVPELLPPADNSPHPERFYRVGRVPPDTGALPFMAPLSAWRVGGPGDSVRIGQPLPAPAGEYLTLGPAAGPGAALAGTITGFTDDQTRPDRAPVVTRPLRARRVPCGAGAAPAGSGAGAA